MLQHLDAVLAAWAGDAAPLATLLPERPTFISDLTPPAVEASDPAPLGDALAAVARGDWRAVLAATAEAGSGAARALAARAIAHERLGEPAAAVAAWGAVLALGEDERARLARGALHARSGEWAHAEADLARAGDSFPARWDRAALLVVRAVREGAGGPDAATLAGARSEAGAPSDYWSDPTVGRLLWSLLTVRVAGASPSLRVADRALLRAAETQFEHATFWDRAMLIVGWVRVGAPEEAARIAASLAHAQVEALLAEPALGGAPLADVTRALAAARDAVSASEPSRARHAIASALARQDLRRFRIPCARCGRGSIGVDEAQEFASGDG